MNMSAMPASRPAMAGFPRPMLMAAGGLLGFVIVVAAIGSWSGATDVPKGGMPVVSRQLRFLDRSDGGIDVMDATGNTRVETITGQAGFVRGVLRGLASARLRSGFDASKPFRLTAWRDGRLTLDDPDTGRHVELEAFGPTNEAGFATMLQAPPS